MGSSFGQIPSIILQQGNDGQDRDSLDLHQHQVYSNTKIRQRSICLFECHVDTADAYGPITSYGTGIAKNHGCERFHSSALRFLAGNHFFLYKLKLIEF